MRQILKKPVISEKSAGMESQGKYVFEVTPSANKIEIGRAVESRYNVTVKKVHTMNVKPKYRDRWTGQGFISGKTVLRKKAIVTLAVGQTIDILGSIEDTSQD